MATKVPPGWSKEALLAKSQRFFEEMLKHSKDEWQYAHWSTLALELLSRSALANVSPTLLAELNDWNNVYYALGHAPKVKKFVAKSISISEVFARLRDVIPEFTLDMKEFGIIHMMRRNEDLHSGDTPFESLGTSSWLPPFYETCIALAESIGEDLALLVGEEEARLASKLIEASRDETANCRRRAGEFKVLIRWNDESTTESEPELHATRSRASPKLQVSAERSASTRRRRCGNTKHPTIF
jgi:hypothetical protein